MEDEVKYFKEVVNDDEVIEDSKSVTSKAKERTVHRGAFMFSIMKEIQFDKSTNTYYMQLDEGQMGKIRAWGQDLSVDIYPSRAMPGKLFPYDKTSAPWTVDNYGPIWIPKQGATTPLTLDNIAPLDRTPDRCHGGVSTGWSWAARRVAIAS